MTANAWIEKLGLLPHPEGGWYKEVYRSYERIAEDALPERFGGSRSFSTAIYFLLNAGEVSRLHRIRQDEVWHFYDGDPLRLHRIRADGEHIEHLTGRCDGALPIAVVPRATISGPRLPAQVTALSDARLPPVLSFAILKCRQGMSCIRSLSSTES